MRIILTLCISLFILNFSQHGLAQQKSPSFESKTSVHLNTEQVKKFCKKYGVSENKCNHTYLSSKIFIKKFKQLKTQVGSRCGECCAGCGWFKGRCEGKYRATPIGMICDKCSSKSCG